VRKKHKPFREKERPRARQNVILELGFFWAKLSRKRVAILYEKGVELPSDADGVLYTELDANGDWMDKLLNELRAAGVPLNAKGIAGT